MKKLICIILALTVSVGAFCFPAGALEEGDIFIEGDFRCKIVNGAVSIVKYLGGFGEEVDVVVPETVHGYTVKYIGARAFYYPQNALNSITLPDTIEAIGIRAIELDYVCTTKLNLPNNLMYLADEAIDWLNMEFIGLVDEDGLWRLPQKLTFVGDDALQIHGTKVVRISEYFQWGYDLSRICTHRIVAPIGSYAEQYAREHNIDFFPDPAKPYLPGDVDHNCKVNVADIVALKVDIMNQSYRDAITSDLDSNGEITVSDILMLKSVIMNHQELDHNYVWDLFRKINE